MLKIATWNVNSINARLPRVIDWVNTFNPDIALFQEIKCQEDNFPKNELQAAGYFTEISGQKSYNGVAILSREPITVQVSELPNGEDDIQARYIEADTFGVRVSSIYLPNGNPADNGTSDKFLYKLAWMDRLIAHAETLLSAGTPFILGGDFNICATNDDVFDPEAFANDALCLPESRSRFYSLMNLGLTNALRAFDDTPNFYSYWDYQRGAWQKNDGLLIDHLILSPQIADRLIDAGIDKNPRGKEKPSDHTPVWCSISEKTSHIIKV